MKYLLNRYQAVSTAILFFLIGALLYLSLAKHTSYYDDDWYSMYAARVAGPQIFHEFYALDSRPVRALIMIPLYILFKGAPFYYALSAYFFRVIGALTMLWTLRFVWPSHRKETFLVAFLFLIYPGFLSQPVAVDFQSHLIGVWLAYLSIGLSIKSFFVTSRSSRLFLWMGAALSGWFYLGLMEYYIGFEAARLVFFAVILLRNANGLKQNVVALLKLWLPYAIIPLSFLFWRLFIFEGQRKVTDVALQVGKFFSVPLHTLLTWLVFYLQDIVNVTVLAWTVPFSQLGFSLRLRDSMIALGLSLAVLLLFYFISSHINWSDNEKLSEPDFAKEGIRVGVVWVLAGLVFVILANRHVVFPEYSRYGFVSAGGAVIFLVAILSRIVSNRIRTLVLGFLLVSATVTHYGNAVRFANLADDIRMFWWQVGWRVPHFEPGTTIVAHYPNGGIRETSFVWGPANQIYYPDGLTKDPVQAGISAIMLNQATVIDILNHKKEYPDMYYLVETYPNPQHIIVLTQPSAVSCLQVIDGDAPEYSSFEDPMFLTIGSYSEIEHVRVQDPFRDVPEFLFGPEPAHDWCYYYEKAALARQVGNWNEIIKLGREATNQGFQPDDLIEWMPFLQAYAIAGDEKSLTSLAAAIRSDKFVARQVCERLNELDGLQENIKSLVGSKYCSP
jgi:hypothetical protein